MNNIGISSIKDNKAAPQANILIVEDDLTNAYLLKSVLEKENHRVFISDSGLDVYDILDNNEIDTILLDIVMPKINGFEILDKLQASEGTAHIPVIMITSLDSAKEVKKALDKGALDYIRKPCEPIELIARINSSLRLKNKQQVLRNYAQRDSLTGLYNRRYFDTVYERHYAGREAYKNGISFLMIDGDHFKSINDKYGHTAGDEVLTVLANVIAKSVKSIDAVFRYGGEEFCVILPDTTIFQAFLIADRIRTNVLKVPFIFQEHTLIVTISIGISHTRAGDGKAPGELLTEADSALYLAKEGGRNKIVIYNKK